MTQTSPKPTSVLALVDAPQDLDALMPALDSREVTWVALAPHGLQALEKARVRHIDINQFFSPDSLWEEVAEESPKRLDQLCFSVDSALQEQGFDGITLGYFKYHLSILFESVMGRLHMVRAMLNQLSYAELAFCSSPLSKEGFSFPNDDTLWGACTDLAFGKRTFLSLERSSALPPNASIIGRTKRGAKSVLRSSLAIDWYRSWKTLGLRNSAINFLRKKEIVMLGPCYEWDPTLSILCKNGWGITFKNSTSVTRSSRTQAQLLWSKVNSHLLQDPYFREPFLFHGIDFFPLISSHLDNIVHFGLSVRLSKEQKSMDKAKAILMAMADDGGKWLFLRPYREKGVKVLVWPHGPTGFWYSEKSEAPALHMDVDQLLVYGDGAAKALNPIARKGGFDLLAVGSSSLDNLMKGRDSTKDHYILYALTNFFENHCMYSWYPAWSDLTIHSWRRQIISYLNELAGFDIVVKCHPNLAYRDPPMAISNPRVRVVKDKPKFPDLIHGAQAIIVETLTTTCLQALTSKVPVFVLNTNQRATPRALELLRKRAVCSQSGEELVKALDDYLTKGTYPADVHNDEALRLFGTHLHDGQSAERAARAVTEALGADSHSMTFNPTL